MQMEAEISMGIKKALIDDEVMDEYHCHWIRLKSKWSSMSNMNSMMMGI